MKPRLFLCLALLLVSFVFPGCVNTSKFDGTTRNLRGDGGVTFNTEVNREEPLRLKISSSGNTIKGGDYLALYLPQEKCQFVLFYPKTTPLGSKDLNPYPDYAFRADIETNHVHTWQMVGVWQGKDAVTRNIDLPEGYTAVWLVRGQPLDRSVLELDDQCQHATNAEPLFGKITVNKDANDDGYYSIDAELSNADGTKISGSFQSDKALWTPIALPLGGVVGGLMWIFDIRD